MWVLLSRERIPFFVEKAVLWSLSQLPGTPRHDHLQDLVGVGLPSKSGSVKIEERGGWRLLHNVQWLINKHTGELVFVGDEQYFVDNIKPRSSCSRHIVRC